MTTQQTTQANAEGRAAFAAGQPYDATPVRCRTGWRSAATERANAIRRERLTANPESRDAWDKEPV